MFIENLVNNFKTQFLWQEIEAWMKENEGNEELMKEFEQEALDGATSVEFDSFLRKRSEAALKRD